MRPGDSYPCPDCGAAMHHIRDKVNEVPENVPAYFVVNRTVRSQYRYPSCDMVHSVSRRYTPVKEYSCQ
ncbi:IS66 family transposase zinc-finger binding domain-containing protein [Escherichia coli]|nr:IS66 family transposase zinc-finger binding domain-containing protein [Escherichia coli]MDD8720520.1 IS66 family transposase zinc-finger binding domain-containing protein [Escherichia coli]